MSRHPMACGAPAKRWPAKPTTGFTLVEMLVVLVIILLLAALLLPVIINAREAGRQVACASNLMQIGFASRQYTEDSGGFLLDSSLPDKNPDCSWADRLYPYAKSAQIFECPAHSYGEYKPGCPPSDPAPGNNGSGGISTYDAEDTPQGVITYDGSYMLNTMVWPPRPIRKSQVVFPESTIQALDGKANLQPSTPPIHDLTPFQISIGNNSVGLGQNPITGVRDLDYAGLVSRHRGGVNVLFVDGHVKWLKFESLLKRCHWRPDGNDNPPDPRPTPTPAL